MKKIGFTSLNAIMLFERLNDAIFFINNKEHPFTTDEFYNACVNGKLLDILKKHSFNGTLLSDDDIEIFNNFILNEVEEGKYFENGRCALMYYSWQGIISYLEDNKLL